MAINTEKSQLGLGSSNILSWDTIDQLKQVEVNALVKPLETKIQDNLTKQKDLTAITTLLSTFKGSVSNLTSDSAYLKRNTETSGSNSASVVASSGVAVQNMQLSVSQLASEDSFQSKAFGMSNSSPFTSDASFAIKVGDTSYNIDVDASTTLEDFANILNDTTEGKIQAKVLNVGGEDPYRLIIQSAQTGVENKIEFGYVTDENGNTDATKKDAAKTALNALGFYFNEAETTDASGIATTKLTMKTAEEIQNDTTLTDEQKANAGSQLAHAQDAKFKYNGIDITRSSNKIDDLILGVDITLNKVDTQGESTNVSITQNTEDFKTDMQALVDSFNALVNNINEATKYDSETGLAGTFQGVREITSITSQLNSILNGVSSDGKALADYGLTLTEDGLLSLDTTKLNDVIATDFESFKSFFSSETKFTNVSARAETALNNTDEIKGTFKINGIEIKLDIEATTTDKDERQKAVIQALTDAGITNDIEVSFDKDGKLFLQGVGGSDINIEGDSTLLSKLGLKEMNLDGKSEVVGGFFAELNGVIDGLIGKNGSLTTYEDELINSQKSLTKSKEKNQSDIDTKYNVMAEKWAQYDIIIAQLESQMNSVNSMIEATNNANK